MPAREKPILMSAPMVRALLAGAKTQTRRELKPFRTAPLPGPEEGSGWEYLPTPNAKCAFLNKTFEKKGEWKTSTTIPIPRCPYGVPGDRLWVRETHARFHVGEGLDRDVPQCVAYRATCDADGGFDYMNGRAEIMRLKVTKWTPAIHMPRWASRLTLEVTDVRVERLQDISEEDAKAEGVEPDADCLANRCRRPYFDRYLDLWDEINGKGSWKTNPWVWVVSFRRIQP